jgi:D-3-phosphoglycerate dehydrogenase
MTRARILVADEIAESGLAILEQAGEVLVKTQMSAEELRESVRDVDAIVVRSATKITADIIEVGRRLKVIARAGVGVDNIDVEAATRLGVLVVNSPAGNTLAAAEHTVAMLMAAARNIPQAHAAMRSGKWNRADFVGRQLFGKTLGIIGFGRIGREVAARAKALGMWVLAFDPFVSKERIEAEGVKSAGLAELLAESDFVTLHAQLTHQTQGMIREEQLRQMKPTAILVNCARGGLVDEGALVRALRERWIEGAALDVFADDRHPSPELVQMPNVVVTPHLGASTEEAQSQVAVDVAEQVVAVLQGRSPRSPVNAPALPPDQEMAMGGYLILARALGRLAGAMATQAAERLAVAASDDVADEHLGLLARHVVAEYLRAATGQSANYVNALLVAAEHGMEVAMVRGQGPAGYQRWASVDLTVGERMEHLAGVLVGEGPPRLVNLGGFAIDVAPRGRTLILWHGKPGQPGFIGKLGTILGERGISITGIEVGLEPVGGVGLMLVEVKDDLSDELMSEIQNLPDVLRTVLVDFGGQPE